MDPKDSLATLFPSPRRETVAGRQIVIPVMKLRQLAQFSQACAPFITRIVTSDYIGAMIHHTDAVLECVKIATGVDAGWLDALDPDDTLRLVAAVFEANADFFAQRLLPVNREMGARMANLLNRLGGDAPLPGLSSTATPLPNAAI